MLPHSSNFRHIPASARISRSEPCHRAQKSPPGRRDSRPSSTGSRALLNGSINSPLAISGAQPDRSRILSGAIVILIGELAKRTLCSVRVIRHYEQCGLLSSIRSGNGYRQFDETAVEHVMRIRVLLRNGFNLDEIRPVAKDFDGSS